MILFFSFEARLLFFQQNDIHTNLHIFHMLLYVKILYIIILLTITAIPLNHFQCYL